MAEQAKTFRDLYLAEKRKPTELQKWVTHISEVTGVGEGAVRQWANGNSRPTEYAICSKLVEELGVSYETLFPASAQ